MPARLPADAMLLMTLGEVVAIQSRLLWILIPATIAYLELLVGPWEERQLSRDFGAEYEAYARRVQKWLPRARIPTTAALAARA